MRTVRRTLGFWIAAAALALSAASGALGQDEMRRLRELGRAFAAVAEKTTPAVVNVNTSTVIPGRRVPLFRHPFSEFLFGDVFGGRMLREPDREVRSLGSGVVVSPEGHVITNYHVVAGAQQIRVTLSDEQEFEAEIVGTDPLTDIAVIKLAGTDLPTVTWGDSDALRIGEWVVAVGSPFGLGQTVTAGIVSAKGRTNPEIVGYADLLQTDAAINPGNSGGALLNTAGEVVGINTAIISRGGGSEGIGFAIPSNTARRVLEALLRDGEVVRGWIGILVQRLSGAERARLGAPAEARVQIGNLLRRSPAHSAGLWPDDVVISFEGTNITSTSQLRDLIANSPINGEADIAVWRPRERRQLTLRVHISRHEIDSQGRPYPGI
ncbi:MAG: trypsin-like peptidase domain-containing protein [Armatimonadota bacterium]